ncbi:MAG: hypothetical protein JNL98_12500 [Bryobacterales bacterium]|nr:hypothetical protein [Bryobacterales bacterium]
MPINERGPTVRISSVVNVIVALHLVSAAYSQVGQPSRTSLGGMDVQSLRIPAASTRFLDMILSPDSTGPGDFVYVLASASGITVTITPPSGAEINEANAASYGYDWVSVTPSQSEAIVTMFDIPLPQTVIRLPPSGSSGVYRVKATNSSPTEDQDITVAYFSFSPLRVGVASGSPSYLSGQSVSLATAIFWDSIPVTGASVSASARLRTDVSSQMTVSGFSLQGSVPVDATTVRETYTASVTNSGQAVPQVAATAVGPATAPAITNPVLVFGDVGANATRAAVNTFTVLRRGTEAFSPASLLWRIESEREAGQVAIGPGQPGLYQGTFVPSLPGDYEVFIRANGTWGGVPYSRSASTRFRVAAQSASFVSFQDQAVDENANGLFDRVVTTADVTVASAGTYRFELGLRAANGKTIVRSATASLGVGPGQISVRFSAMEIVKLLGVDGPYTRTGARLLRQVLGGQEVTADSRDSAGATSSWPLASFDRGALYLTGQNSATRVDTDGDGTFEFLRAMVGVYSKTVANVAGVGYFLGQTP